MPVMVCVNEQSINCPCLFSHVVHTCFSLMVRTLIEVSTPIVIAHKRSFGQGNVFTHFCDSVHKEEVSVQGVSVTRRWKSGRYASYWNAFLLE